MAKLDVGQPLGDNVEEGGIESDGSAYYGDNDPSLGGFV